MAFAAMTGAVDEVRAAVPTRRLRRVGLPRRSVKTDELPKPDAAAHDRQEPNVMRLGGRPHRRKTLEIALDIEQVFGFHCGIGGVRKGRDIVGALRRNASHRRVEKIEMSPSPDAGFDIGGQIWRIENTDRGLERRPAGGQIGIGIRLVLGRLVAVDTSADREHELAIGKVGPVRRHCLARQALGFAQKPEYHSSQHRNQSQEEQSAQ